MSGQFRSPTMGRHGEYPAMQSLAGAAVLRGFLTNGTGSADFRHAGLAAEARARSIRRASSGFSWRNVSR